MKEKVLFIIHTVIILAAYTSFLWLDWQLVMVGVVIYWIQILVFKACVIAIAQYGDSNTSFSATYIGKFFNLFGINLAHKKIRFVLDWIWPEIVVLLAVYLQVVVGLIPLVKI